ncbi:hypothetical protein MPSEU_000359400 [Mayamaea pseudoterrestris]|nr:hypothetical protein MPSEU_000359400 [Mayamaea pseudoterrestris]
MLSARSFRKMILLGMLPAVTQAFSASSRKYAGRALSTSLYSSTVSSTATSSTKSSARLPGTAHLDVAWEDLGFEFRPTRSHVKLVYQTGSGWSEPELVNDPYVKTHIAATALHYGQACFEGLKAFTHKDGSVHLFRPTENAHRMQSSCQRLLMAELPDDLFVNAIKAAVLDNIDYVPPHESNGALYIRPLLFGSGPRVGLSPADEYTFLCMVLPVGDYYKGGLSSPVNGILMEQYDRAAPRGVGHVKVAGNYAADLLPNQLSKKQGYPIALYMDAKTNSLVEEFSTSNFAGIRGNSFITPKSGSVLPSITNKSLMQIARDLGMDVEEREVSVDELESMDEVLAVGTAVVVTPVGSITRLSDGKRFEFGNGEIGPVTRKLYDHVRSIQNGEAPDEHGWNVQVYP